ncbi:hypothetical protein DPEC_G00124760 [Dallia pectoralis]|uniref:Uncharacterized protein n=1 Tax=Dallia pectoralis TaxID=75939 RepID=A0ACC2GR28_DALPE|nr:hypothetical protein DPEC_G00124760 [Dallia pectoralis]
MEVCHSGLGCPPQRGFTHQYSASPQATALRPAFTLEIALLCEGDTEKEANGKREGNVVGLPWRGSDKQRPVALCHQRDSRRHLERMTLRLLWRGALFQGNWVTSQIFMGCRLCLRRLHGDKPQECPELPASRLGRAAYGLFRGEFVMRSVVTG